MPNLMERGATWLASRLQATGGRVVSYQEDSDAPVPLTLTPTARNYPAIGDDGFVVQVQFWDWIITQADLGRKPKEGARITDGSKVYTVLPPQGKQAVEDWDANGIGWLVHTQVTSDG